MTKAVARIALDREDGRSLRSGFVSHASRDPGALALTVGGQVLTYGQVEERSRRWASVLTERLGRRAERVGVLGYRSETSYVGALAALFCGAAFVPLNPNFPDERTKLMVAAAELDAIVVDDASVSKLGAVLRAENRPALILLPETASATFEAGLHVVTASDLSRGSERGALPPIAADDVAYLLFTSGSTGRPKGVPITHRNVVAFMDTMGERYGVRPEDRFSQTFDQTFDLSVFDLFLAWSNGASVHAMRPIDLLAPARFVNTQALTVWFSVPSIPALMEKKGLLRPSSMPSLRWSLFCGEPLPRRTAEAWQAAAPGSIVENLYGPTELTIACFAYRWSSERSPAECQDGIVPIGRPYPGLGAVVVDEQDHPVGPEGVGELLVCGSQTAPGYWRDPDLSRARFVSLAMRGGDAKRFYRTGDRVRRTPSGTYIYVGRVDNQVKVLGHRIELAEVEGAMAAVPGVLQAFAVPWPVDDGGSAVGLVAFLTPGSVDGERVLSAVRKTLPDYMVPRRAITVDDLPLNVNGKVDRGALRRRLAEDEPTPG